MIEASEHTRAAAKPPGRLIAVYSGKGGSGATTIAVNFACALADSQRQNVVIVDLDLQYGDVASMFNTPDEHSTVVDLVTASVVDLDEQIVEDALIKVADRVHVLAAPMRPELGELVEAGVAQLGVVMTILRYRFDIVVVDVGRHLGDAGASVLDSSDRVLLVTTPLTTSLKSLRLARGLLQQLQIKDDRIEVVLNQPQEHTDFKSADVAHAIQRTLLATIPHDSRVAVMAIDSGEPFVLFRQRAPISAAVLRMADSVLRTTQPVEVKA
ncbi:MAG: AAA family ATPase [Candidatus Dormibacteraeota bacterium]|nr:AAA family ATPase [Candidatus Dormibacteraeota bacterium]